ncbi:hypothetical protein FRC15_009506 [Serendipita sp. 397]|nr:hypothetical protein FRC15_009506 [Serendipita sp. 397]KAG8802439.1 hypothetical protein FRC16_009628 [Serendipita sp. 398]
MAKNAEMSKFISLLQDPSAISRFKSSYEQCRVRSRSSNMKMTDGELMSVCAYLAGREIAGSAATRATCAKLGCMTLKTFDHVEDAVRVILNPKSPVKTLSVRSLAEKYQLQAKEIEAAQGVEFSLERHIPQALKDERVICALFSCICTYLGYSPEKWMTEEAWLHDIEIEELSTMTERIEKQHGERIRSVVDNYQNTERPSRGKSSSPSKRTLYQTLNSQTSSGLTPKRKAAEGSPTKSTPNKRMKVAPKQAPSATTAPSSQRGASPVPSSDSLPTTFPSSGDRDEDTISRDAMALDSPARSPSPDILPEEDIVVESLDTLDWETLAHLRRQAIKKQQRGLNINRNKRFTTVFTDRQFWSIDNI